MKTNLFISAIVSLTLASRGAGEEKSAADTRKVVDSLQWQEGTVALGKGIASLQLKDGYRFLDSKDARKVLTDLWGNPPSATFGMIFPSGTGPLDGTWAAVVEGFEEEGYVKDGDADKLDAAKLLKQLKEAQTAANEERKKQGYPELELIGWAVPPHYDKEANKLYWALDIQRVGATEHSVNYFVRVLGRRGYLVINALGGLEQIGEIEAATPQMLAMVNFNEGHRYADFNAKTDKVATYGIAGLIMGAVGLKVAAKLGLLALFAKKFGVVLLVFKKLWIVVIAGLVALVKKFKSFFARRNETAG